MSCFATEFMQTTITLIHYRNYLFFCFFIVYTGFLTLEVTPQRAHYREFFFSCSKQAHLLPCVANTEAGHSEKSCMWNSIARMQGFLASGEECCQLNALKGLYFLQLLVTVVWRVLDEDAFIRLCTKLYFYHLSSLRRKSSQSLQHLCPSAVAIVCSGKQL